MKAILTLDNGHKVALDITPKSTPDARAAMRHWQDFEREFVRNFNLSQPNMRHKVVSAHITRN